ncbi:MAG: hypothetical protein V1847_03310 [Candidatus Diapherotrites archaeon]
MNRAFVFSIDALFAAMILVGGLALVWSIADLPQSGFQGFRMATFRSIDKAIVAYYTGETKDLNEELGSAEMGACFSVFYYKYMGTVNEISQYTLTRLTDCEPG